MDEEFNTPCMVIDSSALLSEILPNEETPAQIVEIFEKYNALKQSFIAPPLLSYEVTNSLRSAVLQKKITDQLSRELLSEYLRMSIILIEPHFPTVLHLAILHKLSAYDASYLALAVDHKIPLVTLDRKLSRLSPPTIAVAKARA